MAGTAYISAFDYNELKKNKKRQHKYGATRCVDKKYPGLRFDSKGEKGLYGELLLRQHAGEISELKTQVTVYLTEARIIYRPDFRFEEKGIQVYAEFKGFETASWRIKRKLWTVYGPGKLEIYKQAGKGSYLAETLIPK